MGSDSSGHDLIDELADDFVSRRQAGESPPISEYCERYPQLSGEIRELFQTLAMLEDGKPQSGEPLAGESPPSESIGAYRILREIGRGGMGIVYEATHEALGRRVALKLLPQRLAVDNRALARFHREARAVARLHHTNIVPLFEVGQEGNQFYLVMQLIAGRSLDEVIAAESAANINESLAQFGKPSRLSGTSSTKRLRSATQSPSQLSDTNASGTNRRQAFFPVARVGLQIAEALDYAHSRGIVHRDVKPSNILLGEDGIAWLTDFGLAKLDDEELTQTGDFVGTLSYMAPERFAGDGDHRVDIYGLGLTLYELTVMEPAYRSSDRLELIEMIQSWTPPRLRVRNPRIPRDLETIVMKAIETEPRSRYRSARAMADDLNRFIADQPIRARRSSVVERFIRWSRRNKRLSGSLAASILMGIVTICVLLASLHTTRTALNEANQVSARSLLVQADLAFENRQYQSAALLAAASLDRTPSATGEAKLLSARGNAAATLVWKSPTFRQATAIASNREGNLIAAAAVGEKAIWIWDADLQTVHYLSEHNATSNSLAFDTAGKQLLAGLDDQTVRLWDAVRGQQQWSHSLTSSTLVALDPAGRLAAAGGAFQGTVWVWECDSGKELHRFMGDGSPVTAISLNAEQSLAVGYKTGAIRIWDLKSTQQNELIGTSSVTSLVFLSQQKIAAASLNGIWLWDLETRSSKQIPETASRTTKHLAINPDGTQLAAGFEDGTIEFWSLRSLEQVWNERSTVSAEKQVLLESPVKFVGYRSAEEQLIVGTHNEGRRSTDRSIRIIDRSTGNAKAWTDGHVSDVTRLAFGNHGSQVSSVSLDRTIRIWDAATGDLAQRLDGHSAPINSIAMESKGNLVASGSNDRTLRLWNSNGQTVATQRFSQPVIGVAFHPTSNMVASMTGTEIQYWEIDRSPPTSASDAREPGILRPAKSITIGRSDGTVQADTLAFSSDGKLTACGTSRGEILIWSAINGELLSDFRVDENRGVTSLQFAAQGQKVAAMCGQSTGQFSVRILDVSDPESPTEIGNFVHRAMRSMSLSPAGDLLVTAAHNREVILWNVESKLQLGWIEGHPGSVHAVSFSPDQRSLAAGSGAEVLVWNINAAELTSINAANFAPESFVWDDHYDWLSWFDFNSDESLMAIKGQWDEVDHIVLLDRRSGKTRDFNHGMRAAIDPRDRWLALLTLREKFELVELESERRIPMEYDGRGLNTLSFNADGSLLAGAGGDKITIWDTQRRAVVDSLHAHPASSRAFFHPTNRNRLASGGRDGVIYLWDLQAGSQAPIAELHGHSGYIEAIAFSEDGHRLVTANSGATPMIRLWDLPSGKMLQQFLGHTHDIGGVDISPDGKWVASGSRDRTVRLWDAKTGIELRRFREHTDEVQTVGFNRDGSLLISASRDGTIRFRRLGTSDQSISRDKLEASTGLRLEDGVIRPIPKQARWQVKD